MDSFKFIVVGILLGAGAMAAYTWLASDGAAIEFELAVNCIVGVIGGGFLGYFAHRFSLGFEGFGEYDDDLVSPETEQRARTLAKILSVLIVAVVIGLAFVPSIQRVQTRLLSTSPMGLPAPLVAVIAQLILFIPVPFFLSHGMRVLLWSQQQGRNSRGIISALAVALDASRAGRSLSISAVIMVLGLFYCLGIGLIWSWYANTHGL